MLDALPIMPRHKLQQAFDDGRLAEVGKAGSPPGNLAGLGPFVLTEHVAGQRLVFARNPRYWRKAADGAPLPYLDTLTVLIVSDQNTETLRMQNGDADLMVNADIRPEDYAAFKRLADQGRIRLAPAGIGLDPNLLWFNLSPARAQDSRNSWLRNTSFRRAISCAVDREAIVNTVYLGEAVPVYGPVSPGNRLWHVPPPDPCNHDLTKARELLASAGLTDRNGDGMLDDASGQPARFSIVTHSGHTIRERTMAMVQEQLRQVGLAVDIVGLDPGGLFQRFSSGDYDAIYFGVQNSTTDPAMTSNFWLSSGNYHFWNPRQATAGTGWEREIDALMQRQAATFDLAERQRLFAEVQRIFAEEMPALYFVTPKVTIAVSSRVANELPVPQIPQLLWNAETLAVSGPGR
jgi:peptide/nickel transport system substrate-binding protein